MTDLTDRLGARVYLDANIYIYALEQVEAFAKLIGALFAALEADATPIIASQLLFPELLARPLRDGRAHLVEAYEAYLSETPQVRLVPVSEAVVMRATALRAAHRLKTVDALHLATALEHDCDSFITNDRGFPDIDDIRLIDLTRDVIA